MAQGISTYDFGRLGLRSGEAHRHDATIRVDPLEFGGEPYSAPREGVAARLDISRATHGHALRLRLKTVMHGPCMRCLEPIELEVEVDAREIDDPSVGDEELRSPYVSENVVDLSAWAHDEIGLEVPTLFLCRPDPTGHCPACDRNLIDAGQEAAPAAPPDPRWAKLRELGG